MARYEEHDLPGLERLLFRETMVEDDSLVFRRHFLAFGAPAPVAQRSDSVVEDLIAHNQQLDMFQRALQLAVQSFHEQTPRIHVSARTVLFYTHGQGYPTVDITVPYKYDGDESFKSTVACFLLSSMLKYYAGFQFPDHVDFRDGGHRRGNMLFPYRSQQEGIDIYKAAGVRRRIVVELYYRARSTWLPSITATGELRE